MQPGRNNVFPYLDFDALDFMMRADRVTRLAVQLLRTELEVKLRDLIDRPLRDAIIDGGHEEGLARGNLVAKLFRFTGPGFASRCDFGEARRYVVERLALLATRLQSPMPSKPIGAVTMAIRNRSQSNPTVEMTESNSHFCSRKRLERLDRAYIFPTFPR